MTVSYRLFRRVILFDFPHDFLGLADRVGDDDLSRRTVSVVPTRYRDTELPDSHRALRQDDAFGSRGRVGGIPR